MKAHINLIYGLVYLYGTGSTQGITGIRPDSNNILFAMIDGVGDGVNTDIIGNNIMFKQEDIVCRFYYEEITYTILREGKIILTEEDS